MLGKLLHPTTARETVRAIALGTFGLVAGTWFVALLTQLKLFDNPQGQLREVAHFFAWLMGQSWFVLISGMAAGFAAGVWLDAYFVRRTGKLWWLHMQCFSIRDAACLLAGVKRGDFEKSDRAIAIGNELRGYVNSGHAPLFLEIEFEKPPPDFSDPKTRYEPPYDKKNVDFDAVIAKRFIENIAWARKWSLPWPVPKPEPDDRFPRPIPRPQPEPAPHSLAALAKQYGMLGQPDKKGGDELA